MMQRQKYIPAGPRSFPRFEAPRIAGAATLLCATLMVPVGCGTDDDEGPSLPEGCRLSEAAMDHACSHIEGGPFREAAPQAARPWQDVSFPHTAYRMAETSTAGWVTFEPLEAGLHVFFLSGGPREMGIEVDDGREASWTPLATEGASCPLTSVSALNLSEGIYPLRWSAGAGRTLVIEVVSPSDITCEPSGTGVPSYGPPSDGGGPADAGTAPDPGDAGTEDGSSSGPAEDAGPGPVDAGSGSDAGVVPDAGAGADAGMCTELGGECEDNFACCSGRCYATICVPAQCRTDGFCTSNEECCLFCHQTEDPHCH